MIGSASAGRGASSRLLRRAAVMLVAASTLLASIAGCGARSAAPNVAGSTAAASVQADLDRIFDAPALSRSLMAVRVDRLTDGRTIYARNEESRVVPASAIKIVTALSAATVLGWDYRFTTTLEAAGARRDGTLHGDLIVTGTGDPSIGAPNAGSAALFDKWADGLLSAGITVINGRILGDDDAFEDEPLGGGWAWDYLGAGYAAPSGALSYRENTATVRVAPGAVVGEAPQIEVAPLGHGLTVVADVETGDPGLPTVLALARTPGLPVLRIRGRVRAGAPELVRSASVDNPTRYFVEALRERLLARGISVTGNALDLDEVVNRPPVDRWTVARHESEPLSSLIGYALKNSQNFYAEMLLKATGRTTTEAGSTERGRRRTLDMLAAWQIPTDALVMRDGSGLSRYDYVSASFLTDVLAHAWRDETLRDPFVASLPVAGRDGTLSARMRTPELEGRVTAKTGTLDNVRSLAGYAQTVSGETLVFTMIANHFTAPTAEVDAVMERALARLVADGRAGPVRR